MTLGAITQPVAPGLLLGMCGLSIYYAINFTQLNLTSSFCLLPFIYFPISPFELICLLKALVALNSFPVAQAIPGNTSSAAGCCFFLKINITFRISLLNFSLSFPALEKTNL